MFWACSILYNYLKSIHYFFNTFSASPCLHKNIIFVKLITIYLQMPHPDHSSIFDPYIDTLTRLAYKVFVKKYKKKTLFISQRTQISKGKNLTFCHLSASSQVYLWKTIIIIFMLLKERRLYVSSWDQALAPYYWLFGKHLACKPCGHTNCFFFAPTNCPTHMHTHTHTGALTHCGTLKKR